jgi:SAM-dependent methyltransferase
MVLAAYAERLIEGRRVVVFGDSSSGLAEHLVDRGARLVHVYDSDPNRVALATARGAARNISFAPLGQTGIAARDGSFDVGLIDDLRSSEDPAALIKRLRRALAARGVALIAALNREAAFPLLTHAHQDAPSYYELYDFVSAEFDEVRMLGQTPFVGYAMAEFNPENADDFSIDTAFVPGGAEEPDFYVALASHFPASADSFTVVQLPAQAVLSTRTPSEGAALGAAVAEAAALEAAAAAEHAHAATARIGELEQQQRDARTASERLKAELAAARSALENAQRASEQQRSAAAKLDEERRKNDERRALARSDGDKERELLRQAQDELAKRDRWAEQLEERAATADARADEVQAELEQSQTELAKLRSSEQRAQAEFKRAQQSWKQSQGEAKNLEAALAAANQELNEQAALHEKVVAEARRARPQPPPPPPPPVASSPRSDATPNSGEQAQIHSELAKLQLQVTGLIAQLESAKGEAVRAGESNRELTSDFTKLETHLRERGTEVARLSADLAKTETFADQLLMELEDLRAMPSLAVEPPNATSTASVQVSARAAVSAESSSGNQTEELEAQLEALANTQARSQADLVAAQWTITELETKLRRQEAGTAPELAADLERAQAEVQRQATLLHQLGSRP